MHLQCLDWSTSTTLAWKKFVPLAARRGCMVILRVDWPPESWESTRTAVGPNRLRGLVKTKTRLDPFLNNLLLRNDTVQLPVKSVEVGWNHFQINFSEEYLVEFSRIIQFLSVKFSLILNLLINSKDLPKSPFLASRNAENARGTPMRGAPRTANSTNHGRLCSIGGHLARVSRSHRC